MNDAPNNLERAYKKLNDKTEIRISAEEWIAIGIPFCSLVLADLLRVSPKHFLPPAMFVLYLAAFAIRKRGLSRRMALQICGACLLLYLILSPAGLKP